MRKEGKILGIPYPVAIFLTVVLVIPLLSDSFTNSKIDKTKQEILQTVQTIKVDPTAIPTITPTSTPSATIAPTVSRVRQSSRSAVIQPKPTQ